LGLAAMLDPSVWVWHHQWLLGPRQAGWQPMSDSSKKQRKRAQ